MKFLDYLETIDMSNNHIKFIQGRSFHKVRQEVLKLFHVVILCICKHRCGIINACYVLFLYRNLATVLLYCMFIYLQYYNIAYIFSYSTNIKMSWAVWKQNL